MVALILRRLKIPGAYLAAAIFALHPVHVESVAWITEQKNTLSAVFYLARHAGLPAFRPDRGRAVVLGALGLFVLGLLSKTVTATLPGALLVIFWWQRGRLSWRRDVLPLVPFFAIGAAAGVFTAWVERKSSGAGPDFDADAGRALSDRRAGDLVLSGQAPLAGATCSSSIRAGRSTRRFGGNTCFRWGCCCCWPCCGRAAAVAGAAGGAAVFCRHAVSRVGFLQRVSRSCYSYVADHFQYLASLGIITLVAAGAALLLARWRLWNRPGGYAACLVLLAILAGLTWRQSQVYADIETLYRTDDRRESRLLDGLQQSRLVLAGAARSTRPSPITRKPWRSSPTTRWPTTTSALPWPTAGRLTRPSPSTRRRWKSSLTTARPTATSALPWPVADNGRGDRPIPEGAGDQAPTTRRPTTTSAWLWPSRGQVDEAIVHYRRRLEHQARLRARPTTTSASLLAESRTVRRGHRPLPEGPGNQARLRRCPQQPRHRPVAAGRTPEGAGRAA